jgi:glycosyltransferase involved in cell wall biosynthesis
LLEKTILKKSKTIIVTNIATAEFYKKKYPNLSCIYLVIHNSENKTIIQNDKIRINSNKPFKIVFTGNVSCLQSQSINNLIKAIKSLKDIPISLQLYIPRPPKDIIHNIDDENNNKKILRGSVNKSEIPKIINDATLLFIPLSWNTKAPKIIATATPGKLTTYLASGKPFLVHSPDYSYLSQYVKENNAGLVVDVNNVKVLADTIRKFLEDPSKGITYIKNARRLFNKNHTSKANAEKLTKALNTA